MKKRIFAAVLCLLLCVSSAVPALAVAGGPGELLAGSAVLMEKETGQILYEQNAHAKLEPASVTKVMTMLLVMEAIDGGVLSWDQPITVSAHAVSMGGSQIWLKENEQMTVRDMFKAVAVVSANDCAVALAEAVAGSEDAFVQRMNQRAGELGMADTNFLNATGLPAAGHVTSAYDIALMSRQLILHHPDIREYTTIWMDSLRNGAFQLSNTNKLIRFYDGATGLKTGFTATAHYCLSATAERDGMELIAVTMNSPTSQDRFEAAKSLLNFGFANYALVNVYPDQAIPPVAVELGEYETVQPVLGDSSKVLLEKAQAAKVTTALDLSASVQAPVEEGQILGHMRVSVDNVVIADVPLVADRSVDKLTVGGIFKRLVRPLFMAP